MFTDGEHKVGIIKFFNSNRGFGFIVCEGNDVFFHYRDVKDFPHNLMEDGDSVSFLVYNTEKGWRAKNVEKLEEIEKK